MNETTKVKMSGRWNDTRKALREFATERGVTIRILKNESDGWMIFTVTGPKDKVRSLLASTRPYWRRY